MHGSQMGPRVPVFFCPLLAMGLASGLSLHLGARKPQFLLARLCAKPGARQVAASIPGDKDGSPEITDE